MFKQFCQQCSNHRCLKICKLVCTRWELCRGTCWVGSWGRHWGGWNDTVKTAWSARGFRTRPRLSREASAPSELTSLTRGCSGRAPGSSGAATEGDRGQGRTPEAGQRQRRRQRLSAPAPPRSRRQGRSRARSHEPSCRSSSR